LAYEVFRHVQGSRKDVFRRTSPGKGPFAELEIYRPGGEFNPSGTPARSADWGDGCGKSRAARRAVIVDSGKMLVLCPFWP
jgi:hypothetical protein